uniref:Uncharacterized protein n=1 Tax=Parascaris equorum TaxID=6256 RepID=A0A914S598_PAREQ
MSETNTDAMGASLNCRLSSESDTSSVTSAAQTVKIPPPYPGPPGYHYALGITGSRNHRVTYESCVNLVSKGFFRAKY